MRLVQLSLNPATGTYEAAVESQEPYALGVIDVSGSLKTYAELDQAHTILPDLPAGDYRIVVGKAGNGSLAVADYADFSVSPKPNPFIAPLIIFGMILIGLYLIYQAGKSEKV